MALDLSPVELMFIDALVKDRIDGLDASLNDLRTLREALSQPVSDEESSIALVRAIHTAIARKVAQELDIPFQLSPQIPLSELLS